MNKDAILKIILLLTVAGAFLSGYIYYNEVINAPLICPNTGCAIVAASSYSRFLGIHVSLWGLAYYIGFATLIVFMESNLVKKFFKFLLPIFVLAGVGFTIYLRYIEITVIKAICIWCWGSAVIVVAILILFGLYLRKKNQE